MKNVLFCLVFGAILDFSSARYIAVPLNRNTRATGGYPWQRRTQISGHANAGHGTSQGQTTHVIHTSEPLHNGGMTSSGSGYNQPITVQHGQHSTGTYQGRIGSRPSSHLSGQPQTTHVIHTSEPLHNGGMPITVQHGQHSTGTYQGGIRPGQSVPTSHLSGKPQKTHVIHTSEPLHNGGMTSSRIHGQSFPSSQLPSQSFQISDPAFPSQPVGPRDPSAPELSSFSSIQNLYRASLSGGQERPLNSPIQMSSAHDQRIDGGLAAGAPPAGDLTSFSSLQNLYQSSTGGGAGAPVIPAKKAGLLDGKDIYQQGLATGQELYRNRNTVSPGQTGYPGHPSNVPKSVDQGTQIITDSSYPHGKPLGGLVVPIGEMGSDPSYPGGKPVVGPTSHHGTPLVDPTHSHGSPLAGPSHSHGTPIVDATISHGTPFVDPAISHGTPFVDPSISHGTPFVDPAISLGTPLVDATLSHGTPLVDPAISHGTPFVDPNHSHGTPLVDTTISHGTPLVDTTISHGTPFVDPNHSHGTPLVDTTISHGTPFVDPTISHGTPFVDPSNGLADPIINPANGPGFVDPALVDPRLDEPGPILPGPVSGQPGTSFSQSGPNPGEPSTPGLGQPWPGRAPTRHILPRPTPQAFVETGGPTLENVVGRDQLATDPLGPAAGRPGDSSLPRGPGGPNSGTVPLMNPVMPSTSQDLLVFTNQPDSWVWSGGDVTGQLRNFKPHRAPQ